MISLVRCPLIMRSSLAMVVAGADADLRYYASGVDTLSI